MLSGTVDKRLQIYEDVGKRHPRAVFPKRLPLNFVFGKATGLSRIVGGLCANATDIKETALKSFKCIYIIKTDLMNRMFCLQLWYTYAFYGSLIDYWY